MNNITKAGTWNNLIVEPFITLSDNSKWQLLLFHEVKKGTNLFTASTCSYNNGIGLWSRLKWVDLFSYSSKYEFFVIQDGTSHRWYQTNAPYTTTSVTGFSKITGTVRSGLCKNSTYGCLAISPSTPWWNLCGGYSSYSTGGAVGIPGFGSNDASGICQDYLALYARIVEPKAFIEKYDVTNGNNIYEY